MEEELSEKLPFESENWERDAQAVLEDCLKNRDETSFLTYVEDIQGEIPPCLAENLLTISAQHNCITAVTGILERFEGRNLNVRKAVCTAVQKGHHVILKKLLQKEPREMAKDLILSVCVELGMPGRYRQGVDDTSNLLRCLELILEQNNVDVPCTNIADISSVLSAYFDDCLKKIRNQMDEDEYDYLCLMSPNIFPKQNTTHRGTCETEVFLDIARNKNLNHLLQHPLLSSFLCHKWYKIRHVLYTNIVFYGIFYFLLNTYILNVTYYESSPNKNGTQTVNNSSDVVSNSTLIKKSIRSCYPESFLWTCVIVLWLLFTIREILLFACCPRRYLMNWENWLQIVLIIFTLILLCDAGLWSRVVVVLLSALVLATLISPHLKISINFEMFWIVSRVCACSLLPCMFLIIIPFGLTFYTLFKSNKHFSNPGDSFFKTFIMVFTSEFNSNDIPVNSHPVLSNIVLVLFAFIIIVFFLVIGLVFDTNKMLSEAKLNGLISRIRLIVYLENIAFGEPFSWLNWFSRGNSCLLRWKPFSFLINRIFLFALYLKSGKIIFFYHDGPCFVKQWSRGNVIKKSKLKSAIVSKIVSKIPTHISQMKKIKST